MQSRAPHLQKHPKNVCSYRICRQSTRATSEKTGSGDKHAALAVDMFQYRVKKYIGAYIAILGGLDALIFTGGIGENNYKVRSRICEGLEHLSIQIDPEINSKTIGKEALLSTENAKVKVLSIPTNEEWMIASDTLRIVAFN